MFFTRRDVCRQLAALGYFNVPNDVLDAFTAELARLAEAEARSTAAADDVGLRTAAGTATDSGRLGRVAGTASTRPPVASAVTATDTDTDTTTLKPTMPSIATAQRTTAVPRPAVAPQTIPIHPTAVGLKKKI